MAMDDEKAPRVWTRGAFSSVSAFSANALFALADVWLPLPGLAGKAPEVSPSRVVNRNVTRCPGGVGVSGQAWAAALTPMHLGAGQEGLGQWPCGRSWSRSVDPPVWWSGCAATSTLSAGRSTVAGSAGASSTDLPGTGGGAASPAPVPRGGGGLLFRHGASLTVASGIGQIACRPDAYTVRSAPCSTPCNVWQHRRPPTACSPHHSRPPTDRNGERP